MSPQRVEARKSLDEGDKKEKEVDDDRRTFLKATVVVSAALAIGGMAAVAKVVGETGGDTTTATTQNSFPTFLIADINTGQIANVNTIQVNTPLSYYYPLDNQPNIIVKLGVAVEDGIGPDSDIISYSDLCQHLGCNPGFVAPGGSPPCNSSYVATEAVMYCCCHGSIYDLGEDAKVIGGPAPRAVPRVILGIDSTGNIYATGMTPPTVYGFGTAGSDDVSADLVGGTLVSSTSVSLTSESS
jgi:arsenite oxidase small subunit